MRRFASSGLVLWMSLAIGCGDKTPPKPSREDCTKVAEHIAELIVEHNTAHTDEWWDALHATPGDSGIPPEIEKATFKLWIDSPTGRTWILARRGQTLSAAQEGIEPCIANADRAQVSCLLAAKSREDVIACDEKRIQSEKRAGGSVAPIDSATPSTGSAQGGSAGK